MVQTERHAHRLFLSVFVSARLGLEAAEGVDKDVGGGGYKQYAESHHKPAEYVDFSVPDYKKSSGQGCDHNSQPY